MKKVAIQGIEGSFHHEAATIYFKESPISIVECSNFKGVCKSVSKGNASYGVLAIENSIAGAILPNFTMIEKYGLHIVGEVHLRVSMNLMVIPGQKLEDIHTVQSHPIAILQSEEYLSKHKDWTLIDKFDTASAAKEIAINNKKGVGAIASKFVAKTYELDILAKDIQNKNNSYTRFFVVSKEKLENADFNKVSLYFTLEHKAGRLVSLLNSMARLNINMTKIQSIPLEENPYEYSFYVDVLVDNHENYRDLLAQLDRISSRVKVLGEYREDDYFRK
ncbi:MAG: prephenate dehydratase [Flavobacteriales bacterium]|nr:prephenate dehydratase [Flavobacteriales bacterium]